MRVLPENYRRLLSPEDRKQLGQHTIAEYRPKWEAKEEKDLQKQIYSWLRLHGYFFLWSRTDKKTTGIPGTPDFCFPYQNQFLAVECKTETGKLSTEQSIAFASIEKQGGLTYVVRTFDEFLKIFEQ